MNEISLLYTTARPHLIEDVVDRWRTTANSTDSFEFVVVTDVPVEFKSDHARLLVNDGPRNCVTGWNLAAAKASNDILIQVSDDLYPPKDWDKRIVAAVSRLAGENPNVVINALDERKCQLGVFHPILTRGAYLRAGYLYPPDFESMFCDNWFSLYHAMHSHMVVSRDVFWSHRHRTTHNVQIDDVTRRHEAKERYEKGRETLIRLAAEQGLVSIRGLTLPVCEI
jgi:hypothetical protein